MNLVQFSPLGLLPSWETNKATDFYPLSNINATSLSYIIDNTAVWSAAKSMRIFLKLIVLVVLATVTGLAGEAREASTRDNILAREQNKQEETVIPLSLPANAQATLKDGTSKSGQVVGMDSQKLTIGAGSSRASVPIAEVQDVTLDGDVWWPSSNGPIVVRGGGTLQTEGNPSVLRVRMQGFQWEDPEKGIANILASAVVKMNERPGISRGMLGVAASGKSRYVVSKMQFDPAAGLMTITVTPKSRQQ